MTATLPGPADISGRVPPPAARPAARAAARRGGPSRASTSYLSGTSVGVDLVSVSFLKNGGCLIRK
jgi:hypothetical protein